MNKRDIVMTDRIPLRTTPPTGHGRARGLVSRPSGEQIRSVSYAPSAAFEPFVAAYWGGIWDLRDASPHVTELLGDPCAHFVFERGGPHHDARLVGVWTRLWKRKLEGVGRVWGVKLRAGALRAFVAASASDFTNRIVPLADVFPRGIRTLHKKVTSTDDDAEAFAAIEAWLSSVRRPSDPQIKMAVSLVDRIARDPAIMTVDTLASVSGLAPRALQRLFRDYVGGSPKWAIRRNRLQEAALRIERGERESLADLAALLGYADQAHLARDFRNAVGKSPSAFRKML
ncbi:MAG: helix-turn-helix transcriptional regulator [Polyangiaceae bacterium]|nr:helix-turn-helix transcriptional regulator [Polyangiaceae bacterium]